MEKGEIIFGHIDNHEYFKEVFKFSLEKFCAQVDLHIVQWCDEIASSGSPVEGLHLQAPVRVATCECSKPYIHTLLKGFAEYFQQTVQDGGVCLYKHL